MCVCDRHSLLDCLLFDFRQSLERRRCPTVGTPRCHPVMVCVMCEGVMCDVV